MRPSSLDFGGVGSFGAEADSVGLEVCIREREPRLDLSLLLPGRKGFGMDAYRCDVFSQAAGLVPGVCLFSEVFDAVGVGVSSVGSQVGVRSR